MTYNIPFTVNATIQLLTQISYFVNNVDTQLVNTTHTNSDHNHTTTDHNQKTTVNYNTNTDYNF